MVVNLVTKFYDFGKKGSYEITLNAKEVKRRS